MVSTTEQKAPDARLVAPGNLVLAANVRGDTIVDKAFISNVKQHGVIVPLIVEDAGNGTFNVIDGQHRAIAAVEAGLDMVPVIVQASGDDAARIVEQLIVNDQRTQLTESERAGGYKQLSLIGVSADQIARRTNAPKKRVELALTVAESPYATELASSGVTLEHAAAIIEFESEPDLAEKLANVAVHEPARFEHAALAARSERESRQARAAVLADLAAAGIPIIDSTPGWSERAGILRVDELYTDEALTNDLSTSGTIRPADAIEGLVAWLDEDWVATLPEPAADASDEEAMAYEDSFVLKPVAVYYVREWQGRLFAHRNNYPTTSVVPDDLAAASTDDTAPSAQQIEADEKAKEDRRRVLRNNKAWPAAREIRIKWIREDLLARKIMPDDSAALVALWLGDALPRESYNIGRTQAIGWLGIQQASDEWRTNSVAAHLKHQPADGLRVALGLVLSAIEERFTAKDSWREGYGSPDTVKTTAYLTALAAWGYGLSDVEREVCGLEATEIPTTALAE